ncbi:tetratricopeptide repeat protein [Thalassospiraceae bacterium LMO-SO8]|nr:tetratricopeptide repeat protein [Alphaproteobacteria bacterium LMO-S08]WND77909.1 tetratricopeptide repeat protein [Thalassospiraceae bacterium LMO-SO8]
MEQFLSDLVLIRDGVLNATADLWVPLVETVATMPTWVLAAAGAGALALLGVLLFGGRRLHGGDRLDRPDPILRGQPTALDTPPAGAMAPEPMEPTPLPDTPEIQGLAEILAEQGVDDQARDGRLRSFAGELDDLRARLGTVSAGSPAAAKLLHDARGAIASGDIVRGTDLLIRAAEEEDTTGHKHAWTAGVHGRAAALARLVAGDLLAARGDAEEAATLFRLATDAVPEDDLELRVECLGRLGALAHGRGDYKAARKHFAAALELLEVSGAASHPDLGGILNNLGLACDLAGDAKAAELYYQRALAADETAWGDNHLNVAAVVNNLGLYYRRRGKTQAAEPLFRRAVAIKEKHLMPGDASLALSQVNLAAALRALGREEDAQDLERRAGLPPPEPPETEEPAEEDSPETDQDRGNPAAPEAVETDERPVPAG